MNAGKLDELFTEASSLHRAGNLRQAEQCYRHILKIDSEQHNTLHYLGLLMRQMNNLPAAIELLEQAIHVNPDDASCYCNLGNLQREQGEYAIAIDCYRNALCNEPEYVDAQFNLATTLRDIGDTGAAIAGYRRLLEFAPDDSDAWQGIGGVLLLQKKYSEAADAYQQAIRLQPDTASIHYNLGCAQRSMGQLDDAANAFRQAVKLHPDYPEAHNNLSAVLRNQGDLSQAFEACREAIRLKPDYHVAIDNLAAIYTEIAQQSTARQGGTQLALSHNDIAGLFIKNRKFNAAIVACNQALKHNAKLAYVYNNLGISHRSLGNLHDALSAFQQALEINSDYADASNNLGFTHADLGDFDKALIWFYQTLKIEPGLPEVYLNIARIKCFTSADKEEINRIENVLDSPHISESGQACIHFALGKIHNDCGNVDQAFSHYKSGNRLKNQSIHFNRAQHTERVDAVISTFTKNFFAERKEMTVTAGQPIFIVGMPRSGTTLVEQILSSHADIYGAGEQTKIGEIAGKLRRNLSSAFAYPECVAKLTVGQAKSLANEYLEHMQKLASNPCLVTDKMPTNFIHLGLIALLFPQAKIVHCQRDPMDTCLSNYMQLFSDGHDFSYELESVAAFYNDYHRLIQHWRSVLPIQMHEISYEELVADQKNVSRQLVEYCGVPWNERCLMSHENGRVIQTASQWQVRQPVYATAVRRWERYSRHLQPLRRALQANGANL